MRPFRRTPCAPALAFALVLAWIPGSLLAQAAPAPAPKAAPVDEGTGLLRIGASLTERGDLVSAQAAFQRVLDSTTMPESEVNGALLGMARTYRKAGDGAKAAALYEKFIKMAPMDEHLPDAYLELGRTLRSMGANKLALNRFYAVINATLKLPATGFEHYQSLARTAEYEIAETYYENGDFTRAGAYFSRLQLLTLSQADRAQASFMAAHSQILAGDLENGCKSLKLFLESWPNDPNVPEAGYLLASTLRRLKRPEEALAAVLNLLQTVTSKDNDPQVWAYWRRRTGNLLANDFFQSGDCQSALTIYQGMIGLGPELEWQLPVLYQVGLCQERLLDLDAAAASYAKVVDQAKASPSPDIAELAHMAAWRLDHIEWLQKTEAKLSGLPKLPGMSPSDPAPTKASVTVNDAAP